ncbi:MFS transporter [Magnetospirillum molischianum]|nr:MFS transporter [Magnetospirillum molischianum]
MTQPPAPVLPAADGVSPPSPRGIPLGSPDYRRVTLALFLAGFATFSLLYCVQPLLPDFTAEFGVSPAHSSLALSLSTSLLAVAILCAAALSEGLGRRGLMFGSLVAASALNIAAALVPDWTLLLVMRALEGLALGGVPAVAMAYLAEEIEPRGLGRAMGLYIAGTALGGMLGRVITGHLVEAFSWRIALCGIGVAGLIAAIGFLLLLPRSRNFSPRPGFDVQYHLSAWRRHLAVPSMRWLFAMSFLSMGCFVAVFNYIGFRLTAPPYGLGQAALGMLFFVYIFGIVSSSAAGGLTERFGRRAVLPVGVLVTAVGVGLTLPDGMETMVAGLILLTVGFFFTHAVASGWVGRIAVGAKGHASSLYLLAYYVGSSIVGSAGGWFWAEGGWSAVAWFLLTLHGVALVAALRLRALSRV